MVDSFKLVLVCLFIHSFIHFQDQGQELIHPRVHEPYSIREKKNIKTSNWEFIYK